MECRLLLILIFLVSANKVKSKTFSCKYYEHSDGRCEITGVTEQDNEITLSTKYPTTPLTKLLISFSDMNDIPVISGPNLNLTSLNCLQCGLTNITKLAFRQLGELTYLNIVFGTFEKLEKNLFSQLPKLSYLGLFYGAISYIDESAFYNLGELTILRLSDNNITKITPNMFTSLKRIRLIFLSHNHIQTLDEGLFLNNTELFHLDLSHNNINRIGVKLFTPQHTVWRIDLSYNKLEAVDSPLASKTIIVSNNRLKRLSISRDVETLYANDNDIQDVVCHTKFSRIRQLHMQNNSLTGLGCIGSLTHLTDLNLNYNNLGRLNESTFSNLTELESLELRSTNIGRLDVVVFSRQQNLESLDISYNQLGNLDLNILLAVLEDLQYLYIDGNNITEFSYMDLKKIRYTLQELGIGDNPFNCTFLTQAVQQLYNDEVKAVVSTGNKTELFHRDGFKGVTKHTVIVIDPLNVTGSGCHDKLTTELHVRFDWFKNSMIILISLIVVSIFVLGIYKGCRYRIVKHRESVEYVAYQHGNR